MYRIQIPKGNSGYGMSTDEFSQFMENLYEEKRETAGALMGAFVLYRREDAELIRMLEDNVYWGALDEISGRWFSVFVLYTPIRPPSKSDHWRFQDTEDAQAAWYALQDYLGLKGRMALPCVVFFQAQNGKVIESFVTQVASVDSQRSFHDIRNQFKCVRRALSNVEEYHKENRKEIFDLARNSLENECLILGVKSLAKPLAQVVRLFAQLAGGNGAG